MMTVHAIYNKCKSRELIASFNHIGVCVSYRQVQKAKTDLDQYTLMQCGKVLVPIPCHFSKDMFTIAAFDNFDHQDRSSPTGVNSSHETVSTLFQVKPDHTPSKPLRSSVSLKTVSDSAFLVLPCQKIIPFKGIKKQRVLDSKFIAEDELLQNAEVEKERDMKHFFTNCTRNGILFNNTESNTSTWAEGEALFFNSCVPKMHSGFLPYIPHPVTEFSTVYSVLKNFLTVLSQLNQTCLPLFCDEGVYRIVVNITHQKKDKFSGIIPLIRWFSHG